MHPSIITNIIIILINVLMIMIIIRENIVIHYQHRPTVNKKQISKLHKYCSMPARIRIIMIMITIITLTTENVKHNTITHSNNNS